ncbi:unnamed protein product [Onchocerca flexuosa]|uniref:HORMA domain-containing protein n=1 Tax=Onchocerca flexuosa TaxID=387005 RepID=A0A183HFF6_9BILA|nr:unnamed protein product [Onchocerca flexuosa]
MQKSVQVAKVGRKGFNGRKALADMVTEFLEIISHTVLFNYGGYPAETFDTASYGSILFHVSTILERFVFYSFIDQFILALKISVI